MNTPKLRLLLFNTDEPNIPEPGKIVLIDKNELTKIMSEFIESRQTVTCVKGVLDSKGRISINRIEQLTSKRSGIVAKIIDIKLVDNEAITMLEVPYVQINGKPLIVSIPYDETYTVTPSVTDDTPYLYGPIQIADTNLGVDIAHSLNEHETCRIVELGLAEFDEVSVDYWNSYIKEPEDMRC